MTNYRRLKLLITGGNGQLASALVAHPLASTHQLILCSHKELDICQASSIQRLLDFHQPNVVINTAAYTKVDQAEIEQEQAIRTNYQGAKELAIACQQHRVPFIHLSTDYIFDGMTHIPYTEKHPSNPQQVYGHSKKLGEEAIWEHCDNFIILRVSGIFSEFGHNFVKTMFTLLQEKSSLRIVSDQFTCPTYAGDIAGAIFNLTSQITGKETLHFCNYPSVSWHQFTLCILEEAKNYLPNIHWLKRESIEAIKTADYSTLAKRPLYSIFNCAKIKKKYGIQTQHWLHGLRTTLKILAMNHSYAYR